MTRFLIVATVLTVLLLPQVSAAQTTLGTFRWRLQPYCNTLTLTVVQDAGGIRLQGYEDLCDTVYFPQPVSGTAIIDSQGQVSLGLTTTRTGGFSFQGTRVSARIDVSNLTGSWSDDAGRRGLFQPVASSSASGTSRGDYPMAFLHIVNNDNRRSAGLNVSCFSHPLTDENPTALISVTENRGMLAAIRPFVPSPVALYLHTGATGLSGSLAQDVWCISRNDSVAMPIGAGFTIQIISP